jgi:hypothetical protein
MSPHWTRSRTVRGARTAKFAILSGSLANRAYLVSGGALTIVLNTKSYDRRNPFRDEPSTDYFMGTYPTIKFP